MNNSRLPGLIHPAVLKKSPDEAYPPLFHPLILTIYRVYGLRYIFRYMLLLRPQRPCVLLAALPMRIPLMKPMRTVPCTVVVRNS